MTMNESLIHVIYITVLSRMDILGPANNSLTKQTTAFPAHVIVDIKFLSTNTK